MKKLFVLLLVLSFVLGLNTVAFSKVTLNLSFWGDVEANKAWLQVIENFEEENPDIEVETILVPSDQYQVKLKTMIAGGNPPDVIRLTQQDFSTFAALGALKDIGSFLERDREKYNIDDIYEPLIEIWKFDGKYYGLPFDYNPVLLLYNKTMFEENGLDLPPSTTEEHWTMEDFLETAKKLTKIDSNGNYETFGFHEPYFDQWAQEMWARSFGGFVFSDDELICGLDEPETVAGFQFLADLINVHKVSPPVVMDIEASGLSFYNGKVGMQTDGHWSIPILKSIENFEWGFAHRPERKGYPRKTVYGAGLYAVSSSTKHLEEAWKLAAYFASPEAQKIIAQGGISMPVRQSLTEELLAQEAYYAEKVFPEALKTYAEKFPAPPKYYEMCSEIETAFDPVMRGEMKAEEIASEIDNKIQKMLDESWEDLGRKK